VEIPRDPTVVMGDARDMTAALPLMALRFFRSSQRRADDLVIRPERAWPPLGAVTMAAVTGVVSGPIFTSSSTASKPHPTSGGQRSRKSAIFRNTFGEPWTTDGLRTSREKAFKRVRLGGKGSARP
jgi:hypothetical protein